ncbi:hypothetical protein LOCC1_G003071 [Lachnellula occidentalis]|uniref:Myb-like domain-containing protein n=1 Tax=Lachnellula occidentalis TaxID=215460 RepID=A0A8H8UHV1_9HELO|nr:hypothetical protein LOCC1_G003071 [Lachnellula occidentalis]
MFINANPRLVSNGFGTFVPTQIAESLHQRLVEMTNNDVNAWSVFRPVATTNDNWDQHIDEFTSNENLPEHSIYGGYFQKASPLAGIQPAHLPRTTSCSNSQQGHSQVRKASPSRQVYHEPVLNMNYLQRPNPMLGAPYSQWDTDHGRRSFAEFSSSRYGPRDFSYQASSEPDIAAFPPASPITQAQPSYMEANSTMNEFMDTKACYDIAYGNLPSHDAGLDQQSMNPHVEPSAVDNTVKTTWWPEIGRGADYQYHNTYASPTNDGLPRPLDVQQIQDFSDVWNDGPISGNSWASRTAAAQSTISPKLLTLDAPSASMSSSGSSQGSAISRSGSSSAPSIEEDASDFSGTETLAVVEQPMPVRPPRQILPDSLPSPRRALPILPSDNFDSAQATKRRSSRRTSASQPRKSDHSHGNTTAKFQREFGRSDLVSSKSNTPKRIEPKPPSEETFWTASSQSIATAQATHHRDAKDDYLVRSKLAGMSYKDIRRQGKFTEAESTLRGRFRTLTKHKAARVRKPEWNDNDVRLLNKAVHKLTSSSNLSRNKVPWKSVAEYIANNGGSYHFGNATCRNVGMTFRVGRNNNHSCSIGQ